MTKRSPGFRGFGALLVSVCTKVRDETSPLQAWLDNTTPTSNTASADPNSSDATAETPIVPTISITSPADAEPDPARDTAAASDEADVPPSPSESGAVARSAAPLPLPPTLRQHMALRQTDFRNISAFLRRGWATLSDHIPSALIPAYGTLFRHIFATYSSVVDRPSMSMDTHLQMALLSQTWRVVDVLAPASGRDMRLCRDPTCCAAALAASISCSTWSYPAYSRYGLGAQRPCAACQLADDGDRRDSGVGSESSSSLPLETRASAGSDVCDVDSPAATTPPMPDQPAPAGRDACTCKGSFTLCRTESPRSMLSLGLDDSNGVCEHLLWEGTFGRLSVVRHPFRLAHDSVLTLVCLAHGDTGDQQVSVVDLEMDVSPRWLAEHVYNQMGY
ncbi:hypothetical protein BC831DRAFT_454183 [Entophlyctis helioformis]|nr:hypothetical protein BC831DRAFT_454183 [Entophlyctis helioformis]